MKSIVLIVLTALFLALEIVLTYFIPIGWILILAIALMGFFIVIGYKQTALAVVISIFLYGGVLAFMKKEIYVTHHIKVVRNLIYDQEHKKVFEMSFEDAQKIKEIKKPKEEEVACQYYTLFGHKTSEHFCYFKLDNDLFSVKELK